MKEYEITTIAEIEVTLDLSVFRKTEELYFNATDIAKTYGKDARRWLENDDTQEYLLTILEEYPDLNRQNLDGMRRPTNY